TLLQVQEEEPVPPARLRPKTPRDLETICLKCLQKEPSWRYASAGALAEDLRRFLRGEPVQARRVRRAERLWRWCHRNPTLTAAMGFALIALLAAGLFAYRSHVTEERRRTDEEIHAEQLRDERRQRVLERALEAAMSGDLNSAEKAIDEAE